MEAQRVSGTSASAPLFAGIIANLNALRISRGLPKLGFLNPWLYSAGMAGFSDVTEGGSKGCTGNSIYSGSDASYVPYASWNATRGWDPVTGIGTPMWPRLVEVGLQGAANYAEASGSEFNLTGAGGSVVNDTVITVMGNNSENGNSVLANWKGRSRRAGPRGWLNRLEAQTENGGEGVSSS